MADTSNILKEAIADAKAVRHTALMNAKAALEEAFDNRLEAMFAPHLEEDTAEQSTPQAPMRPVNAVPQEEAGMVHEADIEEIMRELEQELPQAGGPAGAPAPGAPPMGAPMGAPGMGAPMPAPAPMAPDAMAGAVGSPPPGSGMPAVTPPPAAPAPGPEMGGEAPAPAPEAEPKDEEMDEEINVNELLESLKREEDEEEMDENTLNEETELKSSAIGSSKAGGVDNKEPTAAASSSSHAEDGHQAVDSATVGTPGYKKTSSKDATVGSKRPNEGPVTKSSMSTPKLTKEAVSKATPGVPGGKKTSGGDDATEGVTRPNEGPVTKDKMETPALKKENTELKSKLQEAEEGVTYLRKQLNEINLLNAKLLYTNKLFKTYSMDNSKKMKIVEMFDLAKNVREVKMTYAVIAESLNFGADFKKVPQAPQRQNITEGMASRPVAGTAPDRQLIAESAKSEMVSKFQRLAGIKLPQPTKKQ